MLAATNNQKEKASAVPLRGRDYTDASRSLVKVVRAVFLYFLGRTESFIDFPTRNLRVVFAGI